MSNPKVAAVQAAPVFLDRAATVAKACDLIAEAAAHGARLVVFPESFVPAYPDWVWAIPAGQDGTLGALYAQLLEEAVTIPSPATEQLCRAAQTAGTHVAIGITERAGADGTSLYNTLLYIDAAGQILGIHRKLIPTGGERLVWSRGDGATLGVYPTPLGKVGGLICWENYMPLARYALYAWGVEIYLAPTWDRGANWLATLRHIARESRAYVVGCCMALRKSDIPAHLGLDRFYSDSDEWINHGDSAIVSPTGEFVAGPLQNAEGILYAPIDLDQLRRSRWNFDVAGHYARPDVFQLHVRTATYPPLVVESHDPPQDPISGEGGNV